MSKTMLMYQTMPKDTPDSACVYYLCLCVRSLLAQCILVIQLYVISGQPMSLTLSQQASSVESTSVPFPFTCATAGCTLKTPFRGDAALKDIRSTTRDCILQLYRGMDKPTAPVIRLNSLSLILILSLPKELDTDCED